jgi:hypothetical protein
MANSRNNGFAASSFGQPRPFPAIVVGGLIVGVLDLAYAIAVYSPRQPILIPQTIASGILRLKSYTRRHANRRSGSRPSFRNRAQCGNGLLSGPAANSHS